MRSCRWKSKTTHSRTHAHTQHESNLHLRIQDPLTPALWNIFVVSKKQLGHPRVGVKGEEKSQGDHGECIEDTELYLRHTKLIIKACCDLRLEGTKWLGETFPLVADVRLPCISASEECESSPVECHSPNGVVFTSSVLSFWIVPRFEHEEFLYVKATAKSNEGEKIIIIRRRRRKNEDDKEENEEEETALSVLVVRVPGCRYRHYQIFWEVVGLERGPLGLVMTTEELTEWYV
jgi:hypothetical protein